MHIGCVVVFAGWCAISSTPAAAQRVQGRVFDGATRRPVAAVELKLVQGDRIIATALSDSLGHFVLQATSGGRYQITASRTGYADPTTHTVELTADQTLEAELQISGAAIRMAPLLVEAARDPYLESTGFYERMQTGNGFYLTEAEIHRRAAGNLVDVLRTARGIKLQRVNHMRHEVYLVSPSCLPQIVVDGVTVRWGGSINSALRPLEDLVRVGHIEAIEVYRPSQGVPPQYAGPNAQCGTILIWTRHR